MPTAFVQTYLSRISPVSDTTWQVLAPLFERVELAKGEYFLRCGEVAQYAGILESGIIRAFYTSAEGVDYNKHFFEAPSFFGGYASLITGAPSHIQVQALSACTGWTLRYADLQALLPQWPELERLARRWAELLYVAKEEREVEIVMLNAEQRYGLFRERYKAVEQLVPQYAIASYLGITPTQLSRIRRR
ncbi:Crp/Fnr family transcriptional regulator [Hymenobacter sp. IS2118]|uniref:Crp/Fnr family transcriptional regulator n=1 Tax=Hymenobacter sp. IS2118 TaxID=1505605 RepID=UPI0005571077|nr:Crp/Fnr family transcriptional regulator [Hymenobacter sp. IS2118]